MEWKHSSEADHKKTEQTLILKEALAFECSQQCCKSSMSL